MANGLLVWSTPGATVGLIVENDVVVQCPPYARRWALGRDARLLWREGRRCNVDLYWIERGAPWPNAGPTGTPA